MYRSHQVNQALPEAESVKEMSSQSCAWNII